MKITQYQRDVLDSLVVERLSSNKLNQAIAQTFRNDKNPVLSNIIKEPDTFCKDKDGEVAYYVVKTKEGVLLLYFSLKCGEMFENLDLKKMQLATQTAVAINVILRKEDSESMSLKDAEDFIIANKDSIEEILPKLQYFIKKKGAYSRELQKELNSQIQHVLKTFPAIELMEFCANENARDAWKELRLPDSKKMGECVFWHFILPRILEVQRIIGCKFVYLFAADSTEDEFLINYYKVALKFEMPLLFGANKPRYDFKCKLLYQSINTLCKERDFFYENFNPDESLADIV